MNAIEQLAKLEAKATAGPWEEYANTVVIGDPYGSDIRAECSGNWKVALKLKSLDAAFITAIRNAAPELLAVAKAAIAWANSSNDPRTLTDDLERAVAALEANVKEQQ
jgi:hypothetical protein